VIGADQWSCTDSAGVSFWSLTVASSDVANITTLQAAHTIPSTRVHIWSDNVENVSGYITSFSGVNNGETLNNTQVVIAKITAVGDAGRLATNHVKLAVDLTGSQAIGQYSGTLTINVPSL
jgi:hypothetical protein